MTTKSNTEAAKSAVTQKDDKPPPQEKQSLIDGLLARLKRRVAKSAARKGG